jgi:hypothetical protein
MMHAKNTSRFVMSCALLLAACSGDDDSDAPSDGGLDAGPSTSAGRSAGGRGAGRAGSSASAGRGTAGQSAGGGRSGSPAAGSSAAGEAGKNAGSDGDAGADDTDAGSGTDGRFSFFYTSLDGMRRLSKNQQGFGGDLRFGEPTGLAGADKICRTLAAEQGYGSKTWRAFLSTKRGPEGNPTHAIDRIGHGPWYDRIGRLIAKDKAGLLPPNNRPLGDPAAVRDLPDETGAGTMMLGDTHDAITGSDVEGHFSTVADTTCEDWTSTAPTGSIATGHSYASGKIPGAWSYAHLVFSCLPGVSLSFDANSEAAPGIGSGGGWGGFYCFALQP